jgi:hypothetical protein
MSRCLITRLLSRQTYSSKQNCNDHISQQGQEHCTQNVLNNDDTKILDESNTHHLYQSDQLHFESLTVTIESDVLSKIKVNSAFNYRYSYLTLLGLLLLYLFFM